MRFGTWLTGTEGEELVAFALAAEEIGFDSLWRGDHVLLPETITTRELRPDGTEIVLPPTTPILDCLTVLAFVAAATEHIGIATGVLILALRDPLVVARTIQTLDILSHGRMMVGIGAGWLQEEFAALGKDFARRGSITDEAIAVLKALWTEPSPRFEGAHFQLTGVRFEPKPAQRPHPPIIGGGESEPALRRAARLCDGWYGHRVTPAQAQATIGRLRSLREESGTAARPFEVSVRVAPSVSLADVQRFVDAGVDRLVVEVGSVSDTRNGSNRAALEEFGARVVARL